jgi:YgiT-type zinc finger domain-containing protein
MDQPADPICSNCQVGSLRPKRVSYFAWEHGRFISVPDFPAWVCDVCGAREYDPEAVAQLRSLLSFLPSKKESHPRARRAGDEERGASDARAPRRRS